MASTVSQAVSRDAVFERVVREHSGLLWRTAGLYEFDPERRRDLHQEILLAVWSALPKYAGRSNLRTYLARIAHNKGITHVDREAKWPRQNDLEAELVSSQPSPEQSAGQRADRAKLAVALRQLPLLSQQVVTLTLEGFLPREIAEALGINVNKVSIRLSRAKITLSNAMKDSQ